MHITVVCPQCLSRYQLEPSLLGKRMRCKNTICGTLFEIREETVPPPPRPAEPPRPSKPAPRSPVSDGVPVLAAEPVAAAAASTTSETPSDWSGFFDSPGATATLPADTQSAPLEFAAGTWDAPPVRCEQNQTPAPAPTPSPAPLAPAEPPRPPVSAPKTRRRRIGIIAAMIGTLALVLGSGVYLLSGKSAAREADRFAKAKALYRDQAFDEAVEAFQKLQRDFPSSANRRQYDFLVELSAVREVAHARSDSPEDGPRALERMVEFLAIYKNDPLLKDHHGDVWSTLRRLTGDLTTLAEHAHNAVYLNLAKRAWSEAGKFTPPQDAKVDEAAKTVGADFARVGDLLGAWQARLELMEALAVLASRGTAEGVAEGRARVTSAGLEGDAEVAGLLDKLVGAHRGSVVFTSAPVGETAPPPVQDTLGSYYVAPLLGKAAPRRLGPGAPTVVLALARGVLYACDAERGVILWARRVGVDTTVLPPHVPASLLEPELVLVLSSDSKSVSGVVARTGAVLWQHTLGGACLGRPVLVDNHLLVPTLSGFVEDIETTSGAFQGSYQLGQPLTTGGAQQPGTSLVYFPADSYSVYVLDVARRVVAAILYTGHAPGSLRGEPILWNEAAARPAGETAPETPPGAAAQADSAATRAGWLVLPVATGADSVELLAYALPIRHTDQQPAEPKITVRGDAWSAPWHNDEKIAITTSAGNLAVFGIRQPNNQDPLLFPLPPEDYRLEGDGARTHRDFVIHADTARYWLAAGDKLHLVQSIFTAKAGPGLKPRWPAPPRIGTALHQGQARLDNNGRLTLYVASQDADSATCWLRALDADKGNVLWQRQLGMVCQAQPCSNGAAVLCADAGGVLLFRGAATAPKEGWQAGGSLVAPAMPARQPWVFPRGDGFVLLGPGASNVLEVRKVNADGTTEAKTHSLPAPVLGTPALGSDFTLLPLASGIIYRVPLGDGPAMPGPEWRGAGALDSQPGHIVALGDDAFAVTDGGRGLMRLHWGAGPPEKESAASLPYRITTTPAVLDGRLFVADASNAVTLLDGKKLRTQKHWDMGGPITAGPFARGAGAGVVIGKKRLEWLDPAKDGPAWGYSFLASVVGEPELVDGMLLVGDLQGTFTAFNPATGELAGPGFRLETNAAPTAAPVPYGSGQAFIPLTDGTVVILPIAKLR